MQRSSVLLPEPARSEQRHHLADPDREVEPGQEQSGCHSACADPRPLPRRCCWRLMAARRARSGAVRTGAARDRARSGTAKTALELCCAAAVSATRRRATPGKQPGQRRFSDSGRSRSSARSTMKLDTRDGAPSARDRSGPRRRRSRRNQRSRRQAGSSAASVPRPRSPKRARNSSGRSRIHCRRPAPWCGWPAARSTRSISTPGVMPSA